MGGYGMGAGSSGMGMRGPEPRPGDWDCPRCTNMNFSSRDVCNGKMDGESCNLRKPDFDTYGVPHIRNKDLRKPGDWDCFRCGNINFKIRTACNKCDLPMEDATSDSFRFSMECLIGMAFDDFVMVAADQTNARSIMVMKSDQNKFINLSDRLVMAVSGESGDTNQFAEYIAKNIQLYKMRNGYE